MWTVDRSRRLPSALPISPTSPTVGALAEAGIGALRGCARCGTRGALDLARAVALGLADAPLSSAVPSCRGCGAADRSEVALVGHGWQAGPVPVPVPDLTMAPLTSFRLTGLPPPLRWTRPAWHL